jgi:hypothetical protein
MNDDGIIPSLKFMLTKNFELEILLNPQTYLDIFYQQSPCESIRLSFFHFFVPKRFLNSSIFFLISSLYSFNSQLQTKRKDFYWNPHRNSQSLVRIYNYRISNIPYTSLSSITETNYSARRLNGILQSFIKRATRVDL